MKPGLPPNSYAARGVPLPVRGVPLRVRGDLQTAAKAPASAMASGPLAKKDPAAQATNWIVPAAQVRWLGPGVAFYTPQRVEQIFRQTLAGDLQSQWEMFDLMEATWPRLSKNLGQLKDNVVANGFHVEPFRVKDAEPTDSARERAEFVDEVLRSMRARPEADENDFEDTVRDVMDARGKGLSVLEIAWETRPLPGGAVAVAPRCTRWVHPVWYGYEFGPGDANLKLKPGAWSAYQSAVQASQQSWIDFPDHKFIIALCKNKTGHPLGAAMLHVLGFAWAASNFAAEWFLNFAQVFGQPMRWATYASTMGPGDQAKLAYILQNMGSQAWAMFPEGTTFELKEAAKGGTDNVQKVLLDWADKICDLTILRQTLTSDVGEKGGARAQAEVHERMLDGVDLICAKWACKTLQPLVRSICELNYGDVGECPALIPAKDDDDDQSELAGVLNTLGQAGLEPTDDALPELSARMGIKLQRKAVPEPVEPDEPPKNGLEAKALTRDKHFTEELAAKKAAALAGAFRGRYAPIRGIILNAASADDALATVRKHFPELKPGSAAALIEEGMQIAAAAGAAEAVKQ